MKTWFSRHGIPEKVVSDSASYYSSQEFQDFITEWDILHVQSSPHYPQSDGLAGSCVKRAKMMLTKVKQTGQDPLIALLEYRTTALCAGYSPAEHLMGRKIRSFLPTPTNQFVPIAINHQEIRSQLEQQKNKQKNKYDMHSRALKPLEQGQTVRFQKAGTGQWKPGMVTHTNKDRSYTVKTPDGALYRRNRRHIIHTNERFLQKPDLDFQTSEREDCEEMNTAKFNNQTVSPSPLSVSTETKPTCASGKTEYPITTRSGRQVKPRVILDL